MSLFRVFLAVLAVVGAAGTADATDNLDRNFTIDEFNSLWVREGGPEAILKFDIDQLSISTAPTQDRSESFTRLTKYDGQEAGDILSDLYPSFWQRIRYFRTDRQKRIQQNPLLPEALVGYIVACGEGEKYPIDEAGKFALGHLYKLAA